MESVDKFINDTIDNNKVAIFSKSRCSHCKRTKQVFNGLNETCTAIELDLREDGKEIQTALHNMTGEKTVPRVFINGKFIGGFSDVKDLHANGELQKLLE